MTSHPYDGLVIQFADTNRYYLLIQFEDSGEDIKFKCTNIYTTRLVDVDYTLKSVHHSIQINKIWKPVFNIKELVRGVLCDGK